MKPVRKFIGIFIASWFALLASSSTAFANSSIQKVIDQKYKQPDYVIGSSLNEFEVEQTLSLLMYNEEQEKEWKTMNPSDYTSFRFDENGDHSSSVKLQKQAKKAPVSVHIVTPQNITEVTADMHRNALTTLGLEHADITIASPTEASGLSALAAVAYSLEQSGSKISDENKILAQEELSLLAAIYKENARKNNFHEDKLNVAVIDLKIAALKGSNQDKKLEKKDFQKLVTRILETYQLNGAITDKQTKQLVDFTSKLANSKLNSDKNLVKSFKALKQDIIEKAGDSFNTIDTKHDTESLLKESNNLLLYPMIGLGLLILLGIGLMSYHVHRHQTKRNKL
ncbi:MULTISPECIES: DUF1002 domain-containing protein [Streptococcus]|uniref:DUF1002 domain-containing protein n=1 Tax=Streptococcus TaxID=1301 RepID=UPI0003B9379F|nr:MULTISPECIES: DUF1002 domain-containing protein [Streptococcus]AGY38174.1 hypothetical protein N597_04290 [Streptococcus ilei]MDB8643867.1 DUF1002 domain-containing protein [Streptococcus australis]MDB8650933.1 DUF1002 domain-containing protein [Streptococcus australis]